MKIKATAVSLLIAGGFILTGCLNAADQRAQVQDDSTSRVTVGTVQRQIKTGMSSADVVTALGSPNLVTTDDQRREVWVYDKVATERVYTSNEGFLTIILAGVSASSGASATNQRTLTIVIKYDEAQRVRDYSYHYTSF